MRSGGSSTRMRPSNMQVTKSTIPRARSMSCSISTTVMSRSRDRMMSATIERSDGESPAAGSSSSSMVGEVTSDSAISSWRCSPYDSSFTGMSARSPSRAAARATAMLAASAESVSGRPNSENFRDERPRSGNRFPSTMRQRRAGRSDSGLLDALERPRIRWLLHVGLRIVLPELRYGGIGGGRHVPELAVGALYDLANVDVVDRVAEGVELDRLT